MTTPQHPQVIANTAEEWVVYNTSQMLWSHTDRERFVQPGTHDNRYFAYPISRAEGQRRHAQDPEFRITSKGNDHPFHIHINPVWVLRIDVPDEKRRAAQCLARTHVDGHDRDSQERRSHRVSDAFR